MKLNSMFQHFGLSRPEPQPLGLPHQDSESALSLETRRQSKVSTWESVAEFNSEHELAGWIELCDVVERDDEDIWNSIRQWLSSNRNTSLIEGAVIRGEYTTTPLHLVCRKCPPGDIVQRLLEIAPTMIHTRDYLQWLPLHCACAYGASQDVIQLLIEKYPAAKTVGDTFNRTPLHLLVGDFKHTVSPEAIQLVADGAASCRDDEMRVPLHYACAYAIHREALHALIEANPGTVNAVDRNGRTPLHFAMANAEKDCSPSLIEEILSYNPELVNEPDNEGHCPLQLLSKCAHRFVSGSKKEQLKTQQCLEIYFSKKPRPTPDFFMALQSLPNFAREHVVVIPHVKELLNTTVSKRFPTMILMLDFYFISLILIFFRLAVRESMIKISSKDSLDVCPLNLTILYVGGTYFLIREIYQMTSLALAGQFKTWACDATNMLDVICIFIVFFWAIVMSTGGLPLDQFRTGTAYSTGILWMLLVSLVRSTMIDFAVFVGGLIFVVKRLAAFALALILILIAFAQMFIILFQETDQCLEASTEREWCNFWSSLLKVCTMFLGEVDVHDFHGHIPALLLFVVFMILAIILLANVLIAMVTDSYSIIKNERSQIVFWTTRLDFVAEMQIISACFLSMGPRNRRDDENERNENKQVFGRDMWAYLMEFYDDHDLGIASINFALYTILRLVVALFIPIWLLLGFFPTAGLLWPPQVREWIMVQRICQQSHENYEKQRLLQMKKSNMETRMLQNNGQFEAESNNLVHEMKQIKERQKRADDFAEKQSIHIMNEINELKALILSDIEMRAQSSAAL